MKFPSWKDNQKQIEIKTITLSKLVINHDDKFNSILKAKYFANLRAFAM